MSVEMSFNNQFQHTCYVCNLHKGNQPGRKDRWYEKQVKANFDETLLAMQILFSSIMKIVDHQKMSWLYRNATTMWEYWGKNIAPEEHFGEAEKKVFLENNK